MNSHQQSLWFKRKRYGWGWTPSNWKGWVTVSAYIAMLTCYPVVEHDLGSFSFSTYLLISGLLTLALIALCYWKGETPRWSWGDNEPKRD